MTTIALILFLLLPTTVLAAEGFGQYAVGGWLPYTVTSLANAGAGTLRDAVSQCCRLVSFAVQGTVNLTSEIHVAPYSTIDGLTAPGVGITLRNRGLVIRGAEGSHNVIIRGLKIRTAAFDGIQITSGTHNVIVDRVSIGGSADGAIDITEGAAHVTVARSFLWGDKLMLIKYGGVTRVTVYRNLFIGLQRMPQARIDDSTTAVPVDLMADVKNNVMVAGGGSPGTATLVWWGGVANVVNNFYMTPTAARSLTVTPKPPLGGAAYVYASGNVQYVGTGTPNGVGTYPVPIEVPPYTTLVTHPACAMAGDVWATAGAPVRDAEDHATIAAASAYVATLPPGQGC